MSATKPPSAREFAELEEDAPDVDLREIYVKGSITRDVLPRLIRIIEVSMDDGVRKSKILGFLKWVPPDHLEGFLILALEYGCDKTMPRMSRERGNGKARGKGS
jgi:hypothetical protein